MATCAPARARHFAVPRPLPCPAPVTIATRSSNGFARAVSSDVMWVLPSDQRHTYHSTRLVFHAPLGAMFEATVWAYGGTDRLIEGQLSEVMYSSQRR